MDNRVGCCERGILVEQWMDVTIKGGDRVASWLVAWGLYAGGHQEKVVISS